MCHGARLYERCIRWQAACHGKCRHVDPEPLAAGRVVGWHEPAGLLAAAHNALDLHLQRKRAVPYLPSMSVCIEVLAAAHYAIRLTLQESARCCRVSRNAAPLVPCFLYDMPRTTCRRACQANHRLASCRSTDEACRRACAENPLCDAAPLAALHFLCTDAARGYANKSPRNVPP